MQSEGSDVKTTFELSDGFYASAVISNPQHVGLWLGVRFRSRCALALCVCAHSQANVMVEYSLEEAQELLSSNLNTAERNFKTFTEDLEFLKDQITITEVNTARLFNWEVKKRRTTRQPQPAKPQ